MQTCEIRILPEAEDFLTLLPQTLVKEGYLSTYEAAEKIVDDIVDFISQLPNVPHYKIAGSLAYHFAYLGVDIEYAFFRRKSARKTTWYVFFEQNQGRILVKHITNNWVEGQYIR